MTQADNSVRRPPRLVLRSLTAAFAAMALVLGAVFLVLALNAQERATRAVTENLESGREMLLRLEQRRTEELVAAARVVLAQEKIGRALEELTSREPEVAPARATIARLLNAEVHALTDHARPDAVAIVDAARRVVSSAGPAARAWGRGEHVELPTPVGAERLEVLRTFGPDAYRVMVFPILTGGRVAGELHVARTLDQGFAMGVSAFVRGKTLVVAGGRVLTANLPGEQLPAFERAVASGLPPSGVVSLDGEPFAVVRLLDLEGAAVYAVDSISAASRASIRTYLKTLGLIALGAILLGAVVSFWLARSLSRPIHELSDSMSLMARAHAFDARLPRPGTARELDALTDTFNALMQSLDDAEAQTRSAYVGAIKALAAALDARDPYTAGHSERVSALSVAIGRELRLSDAELDVLRLGALLHDIGKIGITDNVLRKPGPLTHEEFEAIKAHARLGSRILKPVPFLAPQLQIVELHHERPDGQGYPHGLAGEEIPLLPRIVRVADAFDAITTARAYRPARTPSEAIAELWQGAGSQFDAQVVEALVTAWPLVAPSLHRGDGHSTQRIAAAVLPFRGADESRKAAGE
jgi:putative nucleotidyltransferase with HDIG domain